MKKNLGNSVYQKQGLKLSSLLKIASIIGGTSSLWSVWFAYSYLDMVGRSDVFLDALGAISAVGYILSIGVLFGLLALLSLLVPSYLLVLAHEEMKRYVVEPKHQLLARRLLYLASGGMAFLIVTTFAVSFLEAEINKKIIRPGEIIGLMAFFFLILFFFSITKPLVKPRKRVMQDNTYKFSCWHCARLKASTTILLGLVSFAAFISGIFVSVIVLKLNQWEEGIWSTFLAMSLVMVNMQATLLPALFYLLSEGWEAPQKWIGAGVGTFMFLAIIITTTPFIIDSLRFNVAKSIGVNDSRAWVYHVDNKNIKGIFRSSEWWIPEDSEYNQAHNTEEETEKKYIVAKLLYGMGGVKLVCPRNFDIVFKNIETWRENTSSCILVNSSTLTKIGLYQSPI
ncbi:hypothetical protein LZG37_22865 [Halomonas titanicae]|uniref:hypothetical protein n=1 Tax=Vreelandella titanicae TaxID=664683 RepID=UPI001F489179|nr:hypothetical protein [Halomonas titanicae]MCE7520983.1 hypothetical protein [Halomonas titanicae]